MSSLPPPYENDPLSDDDSLTDDTDDDPLEAHFLDMPPELMDPYYEAVYESEGFDVPPLHKVDVIGHISPMRGFTPEVPICAKKAIEHYNNQYGTNYEVVNIVKANDQAVCGIVYYITFDVKEVGAAPELPATTFQARVWFGIGAIEVELCRPKPPSKN